MQNKQEIKVSWLNLNSEWRAAKQRDPPRHLYCALSSTHGRLTAHRDNSARGRQALFRSRAKIALGTLRTVQPKSMCPPKSKCGPVVQITDGIFLIYFKNIIW